CDIPFVFERFNLATIGRFVCMESPGYDTLQKSGDPIPRWCFSDDDHPCPSTSAAERRSGDLAAAAAPYALSATHLEAESVAPGSIQELYHRIQKAVNELPKLFTGNPNRQVFVPVEYQINVTPITDVASANLAIDLIVEEGEGIDAPPGYQSHSKRFYDLHEELAAELRGTPA